MLGIVVVDKGIGGTSHDVVNRLRRSFGTRRIGHAGTLDPLASGVLVVAVGPATRFLQYLPLDPKEYVAEIEFGAATATFDREGEIVFQGEVPVDLERSLRDHVPTFLGLIQQIAPMYSAVKSKGQPLYKYARRGEEVERMPRTVHIESFEIQRISDHTATARIVCSGGTYIRTLAHDLGQLIGCGAHLSGLRRTRVGNFNLEQAVEIEDINGDHLIPLASALWPMPMLALSEADTASVQVGRAVRVTELPASERPLYGLVGASGHLLGVGRLMEDGTIHPECVLPPEAELVA